MSYAQDPQLTQFYAAPTYLSPAFAGTALQNRFAFTARDQWPAIPGSFITATAAFDQYISSINSGIGIQVMHDRAGSGALRSSQVMAQYAYEIEIKRKTFFRPALELGLSMRDIDMNRLVFGDQLARGGGTISSFEGYSGESVRYFDAGFGALYFSPKTWFGVSVHHLNEPNQSLQDGTSVVPRKYSAHGGYRMKIKSKLIKGTPESAIFAFNYRSQGRFDQFDVGVMYEREPVFGGVWYRGIPGFKGYDEGDPNSDAVAVMIGTKYNTLRIGYSYDITVSNLRDASGGAHEITVIFEWHNPKGRKPISKRRIVPCAKF